MSQQRPVAPSNFLPPHFTGGSVTADIAALYRSSGANASTLANFNFSSPAAQANPYFLANILSPQQDAANAQPVIHYGRNQHEWPHSDSTFVSPNAPAIGGAQPYVGASVNLRSTSIVGGGSGTVSSYNVLDAKQLAAAAAAAAAAQYSPVLPPFFAAAAANVASFTNALFANLYNNPAHDRQTYNVGEPASFSNPCKMALPPTPGSDSVYLPSALSSQSATSAPSAGAPDGRASSSIARAASSNFSPSAGGGVTTPSPSNRVPSNRHSRATPGLSAAHGTSVVGGERYDTVRQQHGSSTTSTSGIEWSPSVQLVSQIANAHTWKKDASQTSMIGNNMLSSGGSDYQSTMRALPYHHHHPPHHHHQHHHQQQQQQQQLINLNEQMSVQDRFQSQISSTSANAFGQSSNVDLPASLSVCSKGNRLISATTYATSDHFLGDSRSSSCVLNPNLNTNLSSASNASMILNSGNVNVNLNLNANLGASESPNVANLTANSNSILNMNTNLSVADLNGSAIVNTNATTTGSNAPLDGSINTDLDLGGVTQLFWDELVAADDSVLNDALLGGATTQPGGAASLLLHSLFEFPALQNAAAFEEMMQTVESNNQIPSGSRLEVELSHHSSAHSPHQRTVDGSASVSDAPLLASPHRGTALTQEDSVSMTPKLKEKMKRKERELAEIDRDFARHFNAIAEQENRSSLSRENSTFSTAVAVRSYPKQLASVTSPKCPLDQLSADLNYCYIDRNNTNNYAIFQSLEIMSASPIHLLLEEDSSSASISVHDDLFRHHSPLSTQFPHLTKYFSPKSPVDDKIAPPIDDPFIITSSVSYGHTVNSVVGEDDVKMPAQLSKTSSATSPSSTTTPSTLASAKGLSTAATKWARRKSKRVPIYKQQTPVAAVSKSPRNPQAVTQSAATRTLPLNVDVFSPCDFATPATRRHKSSAPAAADSPYCFTEDDEEPELEQVATSETSSTSKVPMISTPVTTEMSVTIGRKKSQKGKQDASGDHGMSGRSGASIDARSKPGAMVNRRSRLYHQYPPGDASSKKSTSHTTLSSSSNRVDEQLLEQEVRRKLMQISSLHPELRLAISNTSSGFTAVPAKTRPGDTAQEVSTSNGSETAIDRLYASQTIDDPLRHVLPKKRLSAGGRLPTPSSASCTTGISSPNFPSNTLAPVVQSFVRTQVIADTETAKPSRPPVAAPPENLTIKIPPGADHVINDANDTEAAKKVLEPSKPKLIIRIPKRCLSTAADFPTSSGVDEQLYNDSTKESKAYSNRLCNYNHRMSGFAIDEARGSSMTASLSDVDSKDGDQRKERKHKKKKRKKDKNSAVDEYEGLLEGDHCRMKLKKKRDKGWLDEAHDATDGTLSSLKLSATGDMDSFQMTAEHNPKPGSGSPLGKSLLNTLCDLLFCPDFTVTGNRKGPESPEDLHSIDSCEYIWEAGVGFANSPSHNAHHDYNRTEILKLILTCFSEIIYVAPSSDGYRQVTENRWIRHFTSAENRQRIVGSDILHQRKTGLTQTDSLVVGISFARLALRSLKKEATWLDRSAIERHVLPIFTSLLNVVCAYDPVGYGMPYNYLLFTDSREPLVQTALQVLVSCLDSNNSDNGKNFDNESSSNDFEFMLKGFTRLLNNPLTQTYLPNSCKKKFMYYVLKTSDVLDILVPVLYHLNDSRNDQSRVGLVHMGIFILLLLSGERNFGVRLNKPYTVRLSMDIPIFTGTHADLLIIVFHKLITTGNQRLQSLFDCLLTIIVNVSPYLKSMSMVAANKLLHLLEAFSTPWFLYSSPTNNHLVFFILEIFNNIIQYQFDGNSNLIYTIIRKRQVFYQLSNLPTDATSISKAVVGRKNKKSAAVVSSTDENSTLPDLKASEEAKRSETPTNTGAITPEDAKPGTLKASLAATPEVNSMTEKSQAYISGGIGAAKSPDDVGELPACHNSLEESSNIIENPDVWVPNPEWVHSWKKKLPLQTIMRLLQVLVPQVEKICIDKGLTDESEILKFLQHGTLVGLLPVPHPILIRKYQANAGTNQWFRTYVWGVIYLRNTDPPIWYDTDVKLFEIQKI